MNLIHADRYGARVIPPEGVPDLPEAMGKVEESAAVVLGPACDPGFNIKKR